MELRGEIASESEKELAGRVGASLPGGHCKEVVDGIVGCRRASDCRKCDRYRIHADKLDFFIMDLARAREAVQRAEREGRKRDAEVQRGIAALNLAIIDRIDEYNERMEGAA
jgi:hypothetical protein